MCVFNLGMGSNPTCPGKKQTTVLFIASSSLGSNSVTHMILVGGLEHDFYIPIEELIFFREVGIPPPIISVNLHHHIGGIEDYETKLIDVSTISDSTRLLDDEYI